MVRAPEGARREYRFYAEGVGLVLLFCVLCTDDQRISSAALAILHSPQIVIICSSLRGYILGLHFGVTLGLHCGQSPTHNAASINDLLSASVDLSNT